MYAENIPCQQPKFHAAGHIAKIQARPAALVTSLAYRARYPVLSPAQRAARGPREGQDMPHGRDACTKVCPRQTPYYAPQSGGNVKTG